MRSVSWGRRQSAQGRSRRRRATGLRQASGRRERLRDATDGRAGSHRRCEFGDRLAAGWCGDRGADQPAGRVADELGESVGAAGEDRAVEMHVVELRHTRELAVSLLRLLLGQAAPGLGSVNVTRGMARSSKGRRVRNSALKTAARAWCAATWVKGQQTGHVADRVNVSRGGPQRGIDDERAARNGVGADRLEPQPLGVRPPAGGDEQAVVADGRRAVRGSRLQLGAAPTLDAVACSRTSMRSPRRVVATRSLARGSSVLGTRSVFSTIVTLAPSRANAWPSSRPVGPPPRMARRCGHSEISDTVSVVSGWPGLGRGCRALWGAIRLRSRRCGSAGRARQRRCAWGPAKRPWAMITSTPARRRRSGESWGASASRSPRT